MKIRLLYLIILLSVQQINAQEYFSPFSRYGLGEFRSSNFIRHQSLGNISVTKTDSMFNGICLANPATYGKTQFFSLEIGLSNQLYSIKTETEQFKSQDYFIPYLTVSLPILKQKQWGFAFGLAPETKIGYTIRNTEENVEHPNTQYYTAVGGLNKAFIGTGLNLINGLFLGANLKYYFGTREFQHILVFEDDAKASYVTQSINAIGGLGYDFGLYYERKFGKNQLQIGATYDNGSQVNYLTDKTSYIYYPSYVTAQAYSDTINYFRNKKDKIRLPGSLAIGFTYVFDNILSISGEWRTRTWDNQANRGKIDSSLNTTHIGFGVEYNPLGNRDNSFKVTEGYFQRVSYRLGAYQNGLPYNIGAKQIQLQALTMGFGLPVGFRGSQIDLGLELGKFGNVADYGLSQEYFKVSFGMRLYDIRWFERRRLE